MNNENPMCHAGMTCHDGCPCAGSHSKCQCDMTTPDQCSCGSLCKSQEMVEQLKSK